MSNKVTVSMLEMVRRVCIGITRWNSLLASFYSTLDIVLRTSTCVDDDSDPFSDDLEAYDWGFRDLLEHVHFSDNIFVPLLRTTILADGEIPWEPSIEFAVSNTLEWS